jgi:cyclase
MQSRNFRLQKVGNLDWLEKNYKFQSIAFSLDELIVLNASKREKNITEFASTVSNLVNDVFIPIAAGGGIRTIEDAELLFNSGADKLVLNTALVESPELINTLVKQYGSQSIVASIDYKKINDVYEVYTNDGTNKIEMSLEDYIRYLEFLEVGEIYFNSIDRDGTGFGYDLESITFFEKMINMPLIVAGGAGNESHFEQGLNISGVSAVATANLFNFVGDSLIHSRRSLLRKDHSLVNWESY